MNRFHLDIRSAFRGALFLALVSLALAAGCATKQPAPAADPAPDTRTASAHAKGRAELWGENCGRCHNVRGPDWYSDAEWEVAMQQMRIRGYLTGQEHRAIEQFLKSAN